MISEEDLSLYCITESVASTVDEIKKFYRVYHSMRYVKSNLVLRLNQPLSEAQLAEINDDFADILTSGQFRQSEAQTRLRQGEIARDLVAAMEDYERAREAAAAAAEAMEQAEEARRVAVEQRTWGAATMIEVLEAERILTETRFQRLEAVHDALAALAELHFLVGILPGEELLLLSEETS